MSVTISGGRILKALTVVSAVTVALTGCTGGGTGARHTAGPSGGFKPGVLDRQYSGTTISVLVPSWANMPKPSIAQFTAKTGIKVKQQTLDFNTVHDKIVTAEAAGNSPADVTEMDWTWVSQFAKAQWYLDLSKYLPAGTFTSDVGSSIFQYHGQQVAAPYSLDFRGTAVNLTMLRKAGITSAPTTWQELITAAQAVKSRGIVKYPVALPLSVTEGSATPWYALTRAAGGEVLDADQKPAFTGSNSGGKQALAFIKQLYDSKLIVPGAVNLTDEDVSNQFTSGQAAIILSGSPGILSSAKSDDKSAVKSSDLVFTAVPGPQGPATKLVGLQEGLGIPANASHREAAAEFLYWWQQAAQQVTSYTAPDMGNVPSQNAALAKLVSAHQLLGGQQILDLSAKVGPVFASSAPTWYPQFSNDVASMLQSVAEGHASVDEAISKLASQTKALQANGK